MESARPAEARDIDRLAELAADAIAELTPMRGGEIWSRQAARTLPVHDELATALDDPDHLLVVGEVDDCPIGYAAVRVEHLRDGASLAVIDDLFVEPDGRGIGVGEAMMDLIVRWATERGCIGIDSIALPGNRATKNFFESFGLVARAIVVHRPLAPEVDTGEGAV